MSNREAEGVRDFMDTVDNALTKAVNQGVGHDALVKAMEEVLVALRAERDIAGLEWKLT